MVVLRAEGPAFSVGLDRRLLTPQGVSGQPPSAALAGRSDQPLDDVLAEFQAAFTWWGRPDLLSIAAVHGHAIGAGFQLALACDLRILADDAQLAMRETGLGLVPDLGGTGALVAAVGYARALELCVTGRTVGAAEAFDLGLATLVVSRSELSVAVDDLVAAVLAAPRDAVVETKALLREAGRRTTREAQWAAEREAQARRLRDLAGEGE